MDYRETLEQAVIYIEEHLGEDISVEDVANYVGYSYYHLTRQFSAVLGESVGSYIKGRRLADAAKKLLYTNGKVIDIAMEAGFDSSEAFSRAFKAVYRVSPRQYRLNRMDLFIGAKKRLEPELFHHRVSNITVHPRIVELPDIKAAGLRGQTTLKDNVLRDLWRRFYAMRDQVPNRIEGGRGLGICEACEEGNVIYQMTDEVRFSEVAAVEVDSFDGLPEPFVPKVLRGGKYAMFTHRGSLALLPATFQYIWGTWMMHTKEVLDAREDFECYDERFIGYDHPDSVVDVYIPIR